MDAGADAPANLGIIASHGCDRHVRVPLDDGAWTREISSLGPMPSPRGIYVYAASNSRLDRSSSSFDSLKELTTDTRSPPILASDWDAATTSST